MKLLRNIMFQYTVVTFLVILAVSASLGKVLTTQVVDYLIDSHIDIFPNIVRTLSFDHPEVSVFLDSPPGTPVNESVKAYFDDLLSFGSVFRIKVWGKDGTILWSDKTELIGKSFKDNRHFNLAMQGKTNYERGKPTRAENATEKAEGMVFEIYTPIGKEGAYEGVIELYESNGKLQERIKRNTTFVWATVSGAGGALYIFLFLIFYRAHAAQERGTRQLKQTQEVTILALAYQAELRDMETGNHIDRTSHYVEILARELRTHPTYRAYLTDAYIEDLVKAAPLHDIGKVGISDAVLCKPGKLEPGEFEEIKRHCEYGAMILQKAEARLTFQSFLKLALQLIMCHHEKWDGRGYPHGLKGDDIPLSARIMALSDVYDALRSKRCYKEALPHEKAVQIIREERGKQFDPLVVDAFLKTEHKFSEIAALLKDAPQDRKQGIPKEMGCQCA